jgi:hypothetical protein
MAKDDTYTSPVVISPQPRGASSCTCAILGCGCLSSVLILPVGIALALFFFRDGWLERSEGLLDDAVEISLEKVRADVRVTQRLGEPIEQMEFQDFEYKAGIVAKSAAFRLRVRGPRGEASIESRAATERGRWRLSRLQVIFADGTSVDLLTPPRAHPLMELTE